MQLKENKMQLQKENKMQLQKEMKKKNKKDEHWRKRKMGFEKKVEIEKIEKDALWKMRFRWNKWDLEKYKRVNNKSV